MMTTWTAPLIENRPSLREYAMFCTRALLGERGLGEIDHLRQRLEEQNDSLIAAYTELQMLEGLTDVETATRARDAHIEAVLAWNAAEDRHENGAAYLQGLMDHMETYSRMVPGRGPPELTAFMVAQITDAARDMRRSSALDRRVPEPKTGPQWRRARLRDLAGEMKQAMYLRDSLAKRIEAVEAFMEQLRITWGEITTEDRAISRGDVISGRFAKRDGRGRFEVPDQATDAGHGDTIQVVGDPWAQVAVQTFGRGLRPGAGGGDAMQWWLEKGLPPFQIRETWPELDPADGVNLSGPHMIDEPDWSKLGMK